MCASTPAMATVEQLSASVDALRQAIETLQGVVGNHAQEIEGMGAALRTVQIAVSQTQTFTGMTKDPLNRARAKNKEPKEWIGEKDEVSFKAYGFTVVNYMLALSDEAEAAMKQAESADGDIDAKDIILVDGSLVDPLDRELASILLSSTKGESKTIVRNAGHGNGFLAWQRLQARFAPRTGNDEAVALEQVIKPGRAKDLAQLQTMLQEWQADLADFESRFQPVMDSMKVVGLKALIPVDILKTRLMGMEAKKYKDFLSAV